MTTAVIPSRAVGMALTGAWTVALATLLTWTTITPQATLRDQLTRWQFWSLEACLWLVLALGVVVVRELKQRLVRADAMRMIALSALAVALVVLVAPRTNRIFYDEQIYQSVGQNLSDLRRAQMCLDGNVEYGRLQCALGEYNKQPYAYPHLLSLAYRIAGADGRWAFVLNAAAMALTVSAIYLATLLFFGDRKAALCAALIFALTPQQLLWSATAAVEPLASMACLIALVATAHFASTRSTPALLAASLATAYAAQFRVESLLIIPVVALAFCSLATDELRRARVWWAALFALLLLAVHVGHLYAVRNEGWGTTGPRLSMSYVASNFEVNAGFYLGDERFPVVYTVLALGGLLTAGYAAMRIVMLVYFLAFFGITLLFYAGSYNYGADVRYSLMTYPPLAILGGLGAARAAGWLAPFTRAFPAHWAVATALVVQFLWYAPLVRATSEEAWAARADVEFAETLVPLLPRNSYVLTHNPGMFHLWGVNAGQMSLIAGNPGRLRFLTDRYSGGVYLHWNFWCNVTDPVQQGFCHEALAMARTHLVREHRVRGQRFELRRFEPAFTIDDAATRTRGSP